MNNNINLRQLPKNKKLIILAVIIIIVVLIFINFSSNANQQIPESMPQIQPNISILPSKSAQEIKAISDQTKEDKKYADWERVNVAQYPWINRVPLRTDRYFVYFDLEQGKFIGLLYPVSGEDVEKMKTEVITQLIEVKEIPADSFPFKWTVFPE